MFEHITPEQVAEALDAVREYDEDVTLRTDYTGRWMGGAGCVGIVARKEGTASLFLIALAQAADLDPLEFVGDMLGRMRTDSMGHGSIFYWPSLTFTGVVWSDVIDDE